MINKVNPQASGLSSIQGLENKPINNTVKSDGVDFQKVLERELGTNLQPQKLPAINEGVKFSNHALDRLQSRNIVFQKGDLDKLNQAVDKVAQKGSKDALVLMGDNAFVVSVKNKTVVTAMDKAMMKENVFTNIDSTIIL